MNTAVKLDCDTDLNKLTQDLSKTAETTDKDASFPSSNLKHLADAGLMGLLIPKEFGGRQASAEEFRSVVQAVAAGCASTGMIYVMHCTAVETISKHHTNQEASLKNASEGKHLSTLACSERGTGANFYASYSKSANSKNGFTLNGDKCFVTSGNHADSYVVSTMAPGSDDCINTSLYVVEKGTAGLSFNGEWKGLGLRGNSSIAMKLENCSVSEYALLGKAGSGLEIEMGTILPRFLLGSASVNNGIAQAALNDTINHVKGRVHSHTNESIATLPVLRNKIAQMKIMLDASVALAKDAAKAFDNQSPDLLVKLLEAKQIACKTAVEVANLAMEVCGGIAYSSALPIERRLRDSRAGIVMAPTNDMLLDLVGRAVLGLPLM